MSEHCMICNVSSDEAHLLPFASGGGVAGLMCGKCGMAESDKRRSQKPGSNIFQACEIVRRNTFLELFSDDELLGFVVQLQDPGEQFDIAEIQRELEFRKQHGIAVIESNSAAIAKHLTRAAIAAGAKT